MSPDNQTRKEHRAVIARMAAEAFANHVLTQETSQQWLCGQLGTGIYHFRVLTAPGFLIVVGDVGEIVLQCHARDSLAWLRGAIGSVNYVLEKVRACSDADRREEFMRGDALEYLRELDIDHRRDNEPERDENGRFVANPGSPTAARIREAWSESIDEDPAMQWLRACHEAGHDAPPRFVDASSRKLWLYHCLATFCRLLAATETASPAAEAATQ